jgi:hypothetical protein
MRKRLRPDVAIRSGKAIEPYADESYYIVETPATAIGTNESSTAFVFFRLPCLSILFVNKTACLRESIILSRALYLAQFCSLLLHLLKLEKVASSFLFLVSCELFQCLRPQQNFRPGVASADSVAEAVEGGLVGLVNGIGRGTIYTQLQSSLALPRIYFL